MRISMELLEDISAIHVSKPDDSYSEYSNAGVMFYYIRMGSTNGIMFNISWSENWYVLPSSFK